ncbi:MAG TPA: DUF484 family protein [Syntrophales bacterium]|jgi:uncharacterized protein YigA (DUF484 family)|nr:DUF484 family protein [Syntrophales bacterium]HPX55306.1 DUF484 family protein [Syntrophales bacterium]
MTDTWDVKKVNEDLLRKFQKIQTELFTCETVTELCEKLLQQMGNEFNIPFVWMTLIDEPATTYLKKELLVSPYLAERLNLVNREVFTAIVGENTFPVLANENVNAFYRLLPGNTKYFIKSFAVCPFAFGNGVAGSLNCGDPSATRYQPGMDTTLLRNLIQKVSTRLAYFIV